MVVRRSRPCRSHESLRMAKAVADARAAAVVTCTSPFAQLPVVLERSGSSVVLRCARVNVAGWLRWGSLREQWRLHLPCDSSQYCTASASQTVALFSSERRCAIPTCDNVAVASSCERVARQPRQVVVEAQTTPTRRCCAAANSSSAHLPLAQPRSRIPDLPNWCTQNWPIHRSKFP